MRSLRDWGQEGKYNHVRHGFNYRMDARAGRGARREAAPPRRLECRDAGGSPTSTTAGFDAGPRPPGRPVRRRPRLSRLRDPRSRIGDAMRAALSARGRRDQHPLSAARSTCSRPTRASATARATFPVSEALARETLSLPLYPELPARDVRDGHRGGQRCYRAPRPPNRPEGVESCDESDHQVARQASPRDRRRRLRRLAYRRPAASTRAAGRSSSSTTWCAAASAISPARCRAGRVELVEGDIRDAALMRRLVAGCRHRLPPGGAAHHPLRRRAGRGDGGDGRTRPTTSFGSASS